MTAPDFPASGEKSVTNVFSGAQLGEPSVGPPAVLKSSSMLGTRHIFTSPFQTPETMYRPSGEKDQQLGTWAWPLNVANSLPLPASHNFRVMSQEAERMSRPSGE